MSITISNGLFLGWLSLFAVFFLVVIWLAKQGKMSWVRIRILPPLEAIADGVGRAVEMGKPIIINPGEGSGYATAGGGGTQFFAANAVVGYTAEIVAKLDGKILVPLNLPDTIVLVEDMVRSSYMKVGKADAFDPKSVFFAAVQDAAYNSYVQTLIRQQLPALYITFGSSGTGAQLEEAAKSVGSIVIGGIAYLSQIGCRMATCDYLLMGDELYAAGAYVSKDTTRVSTVFATDMVKLIMIALTIIGCIAVTVGSKVMNWMAG